MLTGDGRAVTFDNFDRPIVVAMSGVATTTFGYAPDGSRYAQATTPLGSPAKVVYYVDKDYEFVAWSGSTEEKTYVAPSVAIYRGASRLQRLAYTSAILLGAVEGLSGLAIWKPVQLRLLDETIIEKRTFSADQVEMIRWSTLLQKKAGTGP